MKVNGEQEKKLRRVRQGMNVSKEGQMAAIKTDFELYTLDIGNTWDPVEDKNLLGSNH